MPVKRELWREPLTTEYVPNWHCPKCDGGYLKIKPDSLHFSQTSDSISSHDHPAFDSDWVRYRFSCVLICNNDRCQESAAVAGRGRVEIVQTSPSEGYEYVDFFVPDYVCPSPPLISISENYPEEVVSEL